MHILQNIATESLNDFKKAAKIVRHRINSPRNLLVAETLLILSTFYKFGRKKCFHNTRMFNLLVH
mgnify:CR=1 FL=1